MFMLFPWRHSNLKLLNSVVCLYFYSSSAIQTFSVLNYVTLLNIDMFYLSLHFNSHHILCRNTSSSYTRSYEVDHHDVTMCMWLMKPDIVVTSGVFVSKANPPSYDRTEDLASLLYLNESSIMHSLRQRYGGNLIHTYAGLNTVVINPLSTPSMYSEKVRQHVRGIVQ